MLLDSVTENSSEITSGMNTMKMKKSRVEKLQPNGARKKYCTPILHKFNKL
jgi:hypothetical protein